MAERIVVDFIAEVDEYNRQIDEAVQSTEELEKAAVQGGKKTETSYQNAARKRAVLIEKEKRILKELRKSNRLAFDPKTIDQYNRKIRESEGRLKSLESTGKNAGKGISSAFTSLAGGLGVAAAGAAVFTLGKKAITAAAEYEQLEVSFATFLGSADKGKKVLKELDKFSLKTPFEPEQVFQAGKALLAFGVQQEDLIETLSRVGDVSSATGKDFNELATIYGKAKVQGTLFAEDINQLTEAGVPIIGEFAKQFGVTEGEVKKLGEQGKITFENLEEGFRSMTSEGGKFFGLTSKLSTTTGGKLSTLSGKMTELARNVGQKLAPAFNSFLDLLIGSQDPLEKAAETVADTANQIKNFDENIEPLLKTYDDLIKKQEDLEEGSELATEDQEKLKDVILAIQQAIPSAVSQYDALGNAMAISTEKARRLRDAIVAENEAANADAIEELTKKIAEQQEVLDAALRQQQTTLDGNLVRWEKIGEAGEKAFSQTKLAIKLTDEEIAQLDKDVISATAAIQKFQDRISLKRGVEIEAPDPKDVVKKLEAVDLEGKQLEELQELKEQYAQLDSKNAKASLILIKARIDALEKQAKVEAKAEAEAAKAAEAAKKAKEEAEKFQREQSQLDFEASQAEQQEDKEAADNFFAILGAKEAATKKYLKNVADFQREQQLAQAATGGLSDRVNFARAELLALNLVRDQEIAEIQRQQENQEITYEKGESLKTDILRGNIKDRAALLQALGVTEAELIKSGTELWIISNQEILQAGADVFAALTRLGAQYGEARIEQIQKQSTFENEAFQGELTRLDELKERREINENDYIQKKEEINKRQLASEKRLEKETAKIKNKQAAADRALASFQIIINTASAVVEALPNIPLSILVGALGAIELTAVNATPIPKFEKGTKSAPEGMALVGEKGPEMTYLPKGTKVLPADKTKKHSEIIDAMYDNRLDRYIHYHYLAPHRLKKESTRNREDKIYKEIRTYNELHKDSMDRTETLVEKRTETRTEAYSDKQTRLYSEVINKLYDTKLEKHLHETLMAPQLLKQKETIRLERETMVQQPKAGSLNYYDLVAANKKGSKITNTKELATAIVEALKEDQKWQ